MIAARTILASSLLALSLYPAQSQDRIRNAPNYNRYMNMRREIAGSVKSGAVSGIWQDGGKAFEFTRDGKTYQFDTTTHKLEEVKRQARAGIRNAEVRSRKSAGRVRQPVNRLASATSLPGPHAAAHPSSFILHPFQDRGRQTTSASSPDSKYRAIYRDHNLYLKAGDVEIALTTDGNEKNRVKYGTACWVYGEELSQRTAMWWSPDGKKLAFYRFDESKVPDYYLSLAQTKVQSELDTEPYPKAGAPNPDVSLLVYDVDTKKTTTVDVRDGKPLENAVVGYYVYAVEWSPDGKELLFHRTNRRQNIMEFTAANPESGKCRVIVREEWTTSWTENRPTRRYLADKNRFIWESDRNGFSNYYLYDLSGKLIAPLTQGQFEAATIVKIDEVANEMWYMARDGKNYMCLQLHRVGLDGKGDKRLTDPAYTHSADIAPDGKHFLDTYQTHDTAPVSRIVDRDGKAYEELGKADWTKFDEMKLQKVELFEFKAGDGQTVLHGNLHKPSNFDPARKYPVIVSVYGGPATNGASERFTMPNALTELGFLYVTLDARSAAGRGKKFLDAIYEKLGVTEIDDFAAGIRSLWDRPYVDKTRVAIYGTSYGGYASAMAIVRHPDVFTAACASSPVTDWKNYDSIYTERYMWLPQENTKGYEAGSAMTYANNLKGKLMLFFGTADNNVHPSNTLQFVSALQRAGKSFEVQVGPDMGHSGINQNRMLEFFFDAFGMWGASSSASNGSR